MLRKPSLLWLLCIPGVLGARGCDDDVDLGGNDAGPSMCEPSDCPDERPAIACAEGGDWQCVLQDGECRWDLMCADPFAPCQPSDCGDAVPEIACADGPTTFACERGADGTCRHQLQCDDVPSCSETDCPAARPEIACIDTLGTWSCERNLVNGTCVWDLQCGDDPSSPPGSSPPGGIGGNPGCHESQCPLVQPGVACAEGEGTWICAGDSVTCDWDLLCPGVDDGFLCNRDECPGDAPTMADRTCSGGDAATTFECLRDSTGACEWTVVCGL